MVGNNRPPTLKIIPALRAGGVEGGRITLPQKFVEGLAHLRKHWRGDMRVYMSPGPPTTGNLDDRAFCSADMPCEIVLLSETRFEEVLISDAGSVALLSLDDFRQTHLSRVCRENRIPCTYISEYTLRTRKQIVDVTTVSPLLRIRRKIWQSRQESMRKEAVRVASGLQCNGTPTFEAYSKLNDRALLFFDSRVASNMMATEEDIINKASSRADREPIRLVFSGRLTAMKGVMDLIEVARALRRRKAHFHMTICGDGEFRDALSASIGSYELSDCISLTGSLEFVTELVPFVRKSCDLFVCCHVQGDPSCTYLETMSCGVPIVGYANEALEGIVRRSGAGWLTPMNEPEKLAGEIIRIQERPEELASMSIKAGQFSRQHAFEITFERRVEHLAASIHRNS